MTRRPTAAALTRLTIILVLLSLIWRTVRYVLGFPVWGDEAYLAINFVVRGYREMIDPLVYGAIAPLGFMWAELAITQLLGLSERALRFLPFVASVVTLFLFVRFARRILPRGAAILAIAVFAASYYIVRHGVEIKPYSTDLFFGLVLTILGWGVLEQPTSGRRWIGLVIVAVLGVWCSYPSLFVSSGIGVVLTLRLIHQRTDRLFRVGWVLYGVLLCANAAGMYLIYARPHAQRAPQLAALDSWSATFPPLIEPWLLPVWFFHVHTGEMFAYPQGGSPPGSIATFVLVVVGVVRLWPKHRELVLLLLMPFAMTFCAAVIEAYPYGGSARIAQYVAPAICLLAGCGLSTVLARLLSPFRYPKGLVVAVVILAILPVAGMVIDVIQPYKSDSDALRRDAMAEVADLTAPQDHWVIFNANRRVDYAPFLGDWRGVGGGFVFEVSRLAPERLDWAPPAETLQPVPGHRTWLLALKAERKEKNISFPAEQWEAYKRAIRANLGEPNHVLLYEVNKRENKRAWIEVLRFDPPER